MNNSWFDLDEFLKNTNKKNIILDTNVLLLLLGGLEDKNILKKLKSTKMFSEEDYELLTKIVSEFTNIITTPNILTEFSNLNKHNYYRKKLFNRFCLLIKQGYLKEEFIDIYDIICDYEMKYLGVADVSLKELSKKYNYSVISTDSALYDSLLRINLPCINFNHYIQLS